MATGTGSLTVRRITAAGVGEAVSPTSGGVLTVRRITASGAGSSSIVGNGAASVYRIRSNAIGVVSCIGDGAATVRRIGAAGLGGVPAICVGAGTVRRIVSAIEGLVTATGVLAGTVRRIQGKSGTRYNLTIESKPVPAGEKLKDFGELFTMMGYCEFYDSSPFALTLVSDYARFEAPTDYAELNEVVNEQSTSEQPYFRQSIQAVPLEGFFGTMFHYELVKAVPTDGQFKWFGVEYNIIPLKHIDPEFLAPEIVPPE